MDNVGEDRWAAAWRIRSLMASGAHVALSSDWQVGEMDPLVGLYSALTRASLDGSASWTADERIGLDAALAGYTREGAWAWHAEGDLGVLRVGARADLVAWSGDLYELAADPAALLDQHAALTVVGGAVVHDAATAGPAAEDHTPPTRCSAASR
jgi:predicted amidohydrolase YtcJ